VQSEAEWKIFRTLGVNAATGPIFGIEKAAK